MKLPPFSTSTLLLLTAFVGISCGSFLTLKWYFSYHDTFDWYVLALNSIVVAAPFWIAIVFAAYAIGRRRLTLPLIIAFAMTEVLAFVSIKWLPTIFRWVSGQEHHANRVWRAPRARSESKSFQRKVSVAGDFLRARPTLFFSNGQPIWRRSTQLSKIDLLPAICAFSVEVGFFPTSGDFARSSLAASCFHQTAGHRVTFQQNRWGTERARQLKA
jgi:hypothetical protein